MNGGLPFGSAYGVGRLEVERFIEGNRVVKDWLGKFSGKTVERNAYRLCRFFKWLRVVKKVDVSPRALLNEQMVLRRSGDVLERRKHLGLVMEHSRDNPDFKGFSDSWKYSIFATIKNFYDYHEVALTSATGVFGRHRKVKNSRRQITLAEAKRIIGLMPQRERAILLIILQSGMEIHAVLGKMNFMYDEIVGQIAEGKQRVKVILNGRKGNNLTYFTFFSRDAIQELEKWLAVRQQIVKERGEPEHHAIFLTKEATPYLENSYYQIIDYYRRKKKLPHFVTHQFRKLFKTEASIPERGIDRNVVEFFMGHVSGLANVGGVYDKTPEIHEDVIEKEYAKLEPYINIYTSKAVTARTDPLFQKFEALSEIPGVRESLEEIVDLLESRIDLTLRKHGLGQIKENQLT